MLIRLGKNGKKIIAYGAAAKGNTLLNYAGIKPVLLTHVIDRANSKQNKFLPGSHIPIVSEEILDSTKYDTLLILPWNILDEIAEQFNGKYELVRFIPEFKVYPKKS